MNLVIGLSLAIAVGMAGAETAPANISWVPHQAKCPVTLSDVTLNREGQPSELFSRLVVQNGGATPIDEVVFGVLVGSNHLNRPRQVMAKRVVAVRVEPGGSANVDLHLGPQQYPQPTSDDGVLVTLGVLRVTAGGQTLWESPAERTGMFATFETVDKSEPGVCTDDEGRPSSAGVVIFKGDKAYKCTSEGVWAPK
jgi:hypothetical protein